LLHLVLESPLSFLLVAVDLGLLAAIGWLAVALRRARGRTRDSAARLATRTAELEAVPIGFVVHDREGRVIDSNPRARQILGDAPISLLVGSKDADGWRLITAKHTMLEGTPNPETQHFGSCQEFHPLLLGLESPNFETTWIELQSVPLPPSLAVPSGATLSAFCDVTARVQQDVQAKVESERLRGMLDSMDDVIWSYDAATRTPRFLSRGIESLLGRSVEEFMRQPRLLLDAIHPDDRKLVEEARDELEQVGALTMEYRIVRADGTVRWVQERCRMSFTGEGHPSLIEGITTDVTERQAAQAAVTRATAVALENARMKAEFLANMSHEIRTPLNGILGMSDLALQAPLPPDLRDYLKTIRASGESLLLTLNNLIDFSVLEAGRVDLDNVPFRLGDTLAEALRAITPRCQIKGVELLATIEPSLSLDRVGDPERLRQILVHLLDNAVKFTEDGEIELSVAPDPRGDTSIRFTVRDSGIGIEPAQANRIFDAFVQADGSHTRRHGGNGLGLAIAAELVHLMHGEIWVDSDAGHGSTFQFVVPLPLALSSESSMPDPMLECLRGRTALVVDDHEGSRHVLARLLSALGVRVLGTGSPDVAIATMRQSTIEKAPIDLLFIDSTLEGIDGFDLMRRLRLLPEAHGVDTVMLIASSVKGEARRAQEAGLLAVVPKPILPELLHERLAAGLRRRATSTPESVSRAPGPVPSEAPPPTAEPASRGRILLAEDNLVNQKLAVRLLERRGYLVTVVGNGKLAVEAHHQDPHDLILMDLQMPVMDGFEATAEIRRQEQGSRRHTPIVALTAHAMKGDRERCLLAGMDDYVTKPIQPGALFAAIDSLLARPKDDGESAGPASPRDAA